MSAATTSPRPGPDVIVVVGGLGGLSAAFALARPGLRVRVLERSREFGEIGAGIQIAAYRWPPLRRWPPALGPRPA